MKGNDQNAHVIICLSHLLNLLFQRFVFRNVKIVDFCVKKKNKTKNTIMAGNTLQTR